MPKRLPLVDQLKREARKGTSAIPTAHFHSTHVLFIQHQLGPLVARLAAMSADGMSPDLCWFVDIPYSSNEQVRRLIGRSAGERLATPLSDPLADYGPTQLSRVESAITRIADTLGGDRLLVVDDGAYFIRALYKLRHDRHLLARFRGRTHIVEQTTRGHRLFTDDDSSPYREFLQKMGAPVVSIARCRTKTEFEGPVIGAAVRRALLPRLAGVNPSALGRTAVIGFGTVGRAVFVKLRDQFPESPIDVIDCDPEKHSKIRSERGRPFSRLPRREKYQLLVGCTGYASFDLDDRGCLAEEATLVSCSSAAVEFNRSRFVEKAKELPDDEFKIVSPPPGSGDIRTTISITDDYRTIDFLHAGFPINFDGEIEHIPYRFIQVTHTLLYAAAWQALRSERPGIQGLAPQTDEWILHHAFQALEDKDRDLSFW